MECSGTTLDSETSLLGITLYLAHKDKILAYVNVRDSKCSTSVSYSACFIDDKDYRNTRLMTLVTAPGDSLPHLYSCNITGFRAGKAYLVTWSHAVPSHSMYLSLHL